ncbi:Kelch repeat-containing protein [Dyella silvae]|uniref:Kelch repeat-containing protein n=1 Tax=Dyella silvae TaxID=2994424 RepID=UPI0022651219|nr:kelch repeat-containing protein [Dyella silvae]
MAGWTPLTTQPGFSANHMMLMTDGTVLVQELATANWHKLSPDAFGSYVNGSWTSLAVGPVGPTYFASAVMRDGRIFMAGGEDNFGSDSVDINACEIYDPVNNTWTTINGPGWANIGDAPCCVLPDGRILLGNINTTATAIYDPVANSWSNGATKNDASSEETWTLLPDQTILVAECSNHPATEKYVIPGEKWVSAGSTPAGHDLVQSSIGSSNEIGPAILMTDGRVFAIGASGHTAIYTMPPVADQQGTWTAGPDFPSDSMGRPFQAFDAPAALLPNGHVLCLAGPVKSDGWAGPCHCYEFDGTSLNPVPDPPNGGGTVETWYARMLLLPTGEVLLSTRSNDIRVYQADGTPDPSWAPQITSCPSNLKPGFSYTVQGRQLNGLSQANSYGDDATMATNFPLVRITNSSTGHVRYCRTHDFSTMAVATGNVVHSAKFDVPSDIELGPSILCVVANGIEQCISVSVSHKLWKELKWEIKEIKENVKVEVDVIQKSIVADLPKFKDNEGDPFLPNAGDPQWMQIIQMIIERTDQLQAQMTELRTFIRGEERPQPGESALAAEVPAPAAKPASKTASKSTKDTGPKGKGSKR